MCGKQLCHSCAHEFEPPLCHECGAESINKQRKHIYFRFAAVIILFCMSIGSPEVVVIPLVVYGWRALRRITPEVFLVLPLIGWGVYFLCKFILAALIGVVATPMGIYKDIQFLKNNKKIEM